MGGGEVEKHEESPESVSMDETITVISADYLQQKSDNEK